MPSMAALEKAVRFKDAHARLHAELHQLPATQGRCLVAALLEAAQLDEAFGALKVLRLLQFVKRVGEQRAFTLLRAVGIFQTAMTCRVRDLTDRQRRALAGLLRDDAERWEEAA